MVHPALVLAGAIGLGYLVDKFSEDEKEDAASDADQDEAETESKNESTGGSPQTNSGSERKERYSADVNESYIAHKQAGQRDAPVDLGDVYEILVEEERPHHSGGRVLKGEYEGFVVFVKDAPEHIDVDDVINVKITSFNTKGTSADAKVVGS